MTGVGPTKPFSELFGKRAAYMKFGLERVALALRQLDASLGQRALPKRAVTILIGGTNGKGSTSGFLARMFGQAGLKVGLYTSPHLVNYRERFWVYPAPCQDEELQALLDRLKVDILSPELFDTLTFFEISTVLAAFLFAKRSVDVAIFEVGLGGRLDSTNALDPDLSAVVSIGFDHEAWLGDSLAKIAAEKIAIKRAGHPLFWGEPAECWEPYLEVLERDGFAHPGGFFARGQHFERRGDRCHVEGRNSLSLPNWILAQASHLQDNFCLALAIYEQLRESKLWAERCGIEDAPLVELDRHLLESPLSSRPPSLVGRTQRLNYRGADSKEWEVLLDVCHNPAGLERLLSHLPNLREADSQSYQLAIVTILKDKAVDAMLDRLRENFQVLLLFQVENERSITKDGLAHRHQDLKLHSSFANALRCLHAGDYMPHTSFVVCGSVFGIGEALECFEIDLDQAFDAQQGDRNPLTPLIVGKDLSLGLQDCP